MKLLDILPKLNSPLTLDFSGKKQQFSSKSSIPESFMNHEILSISASAGSIVITLGEPKKVATLEELGYSFETGV